MNKMITIMIIFLAVSTTMFAQAGLHNSPESSSANFSCTVIEQLAVTPNPANHDNLWWPTIPIGSKYYFGSKPGENSDTKSIFMFSGETNKSLSITLQTQRELDNVEVAFSFKGSTTGFGGPPANLQDLSFENDNEIVDLNGDGKYWLQIIYEWVWAKPGATPGERYFVQLISVSYNGI